MHRSQSKYFHTAAKMDDALLALLEQKPFAYITVSEICAKAGVNRSTFYLHYENTADLLAEATDRLLDDFQSYFTQEPLQAGIPEDMNYLSERYLAPYLSYIRDHRRIFQTVLDHAATFETERIFHRMYEGIFSPILSHFRYPAGDQKYVMLFYLNGITAIVREWLHHDCSVPIGDLIRIITECVYGLDRSPHSIPQP